MARYTYGGQALIEGVLMRGRDAIAVAFRSPQGGIVWETERLDSGFHGSRWARLAFVRGLVVLYETLIVGTRWLVRSASLAASEDGVELGRGAVVAMLGVTLAAGIGIFFLLPLAIATLTTSQTDNGVARNLVEGLVKVALFLGYLALVGQSKEIRRVFQYHGAEHMTIHALEAGDPLTTDAVRKYPTAHQRCGTEFLVVVIALSIVMFSLVGRQSALITIGSRIVLIPVIAAVGYELLRLGARYRANPIVKAVMWPGILVQKITTRQPTDDMIEVAIVSMEQALLADGETVPSGSAGFEREPLAEAEARFRSELAAARAAEGQAGDPAPEAERPVPGG